MQSIFFRNKQKSLVLFLLFLAGGVFSQSKEAIFSPAEGADKSREKLPPESFFQVGYSKNTFSEVNERDALAANYLLTKRLVKKTELNLAFEASIYYNLPDIENDVRSNNLDLVVLMPEEFVEISTHVSLDPILISLNDDQVFDEYVLLVAKAKNIQSLNDLHNRQIVLATGQGGKLPHIWLDVTLRKHQLPTADNFARIKSVSAVSKAVLPVFFGQADACLVTKRGYNTMAELNPQIGQNLQILASSPRFAHKLVCINPFVKNGGNMGTLKDELSRLSDDAEGQQILKIFKTDDLAPFEPSYLESVRSLLKEYNDANVSATTKLH